MSSSDPGVTESGSTAHCAECQARLAHDQRYCVECGCRRGPLPADVSQLIGAIHEQGPAATLPADAPLGTDFASYANLRDEVFEIAVTPDRGYAVSVRGTARELASAFGVPFRDPAETALPGATVLGGPLDFVGPDVYPARIADPTACDRFVLREVREFDPAALTPLWMRVRLARSGMRSVSLAVDVTNYLMLELGQPLHAFDRSKLAGEIVVRRARPGERLETLDHVVRTLDPADILITDASGPISMAGTMGGLNTEIDETSTNLVIEAAHFDARGTATMSRRHKLHSEASYRFERGVDRELPLRASAKAVAMLAGLGDSRSRNHRALPRLGADHRPATGVQPARAHLGRRADPDGPVDGHGSHALGPAEERISLGQVLQHGGRAGGHRQVRLRGPPGPRRVPGDRPGQRDRGRDGSQSRRRRARLGPGTARDHIHGHRRPPDGPVRGEPERPRPHLSRDHQAFHLNPPAIRHTFKGAASSVSTSVGSG